MSEKKKRGSCRLTSRWPQKRQARGEYIHARPLEGFAMEQAILSPEALNLDTTVQHHRAVHADVARGRGGDQKEVATFKRAGEQSRRSSTVVKHGQSQSSEREILQRQTSFLVLVSAETSVLRTLAVGQGKPSDLGPIALQMTLLSRVRARNSRPSSWRPTFSHREIKRSPGSPSFR